MVQQAEQALKTLYTQQIGTPVESVNCPDNIKFQTGNAFECQATAQGVKFTIQVNMENDQGRFDSQTKGILILSRIEELLEKTVKEKAKIDVNADCGGRVRAAKAGETFTCEIKDNKGQSRKAQITVKDEIGNISVKI
jgi:DNA gyrase/topoisomerase IV subunit B